MALNVADFNDVVCWVDDVVTLGIGYFDDAVD